MFKILLFIYFADTTFKNIIIDKNQRQTKTRKKGIDIDKTRKKYQENNNVFALSGNMLIFIDEHMVFRKTY